MNWTWNIRGCDGAMNGLQVARCARGGGLTRVLIHAAPAQTSLELRSDDDDLARVDIDRDGEYSPMTLVSLDGGLRRTEVWPEKSMHGLPVLVAGEEVGLLTPGAMPRITVGGNGRSTSPTIERPADWALPHQQLAR